MLVPLILLARDAGGLVFFKILGLDFLGAIPEENNFSLSTGVAAFVGETLHALVDLVAQANSGDAEVMLDASAGGCTLSALTQSLLRHRLRPYSASTHSLFRHRLRPYSASTQSLFRHRLRPYSASIRFCRLESPQREMLSLHLASTLLT